MAVSTEPLTATVSPIGDALQRQLAEALPMARTQAQSKWYDVVLFIAYGLLNNGLICVCYGAAQDIVNVYGFPDSAPLVTLISTVAAIAAPILLMSWPLRITGYRVRCIVSCVIGLVGLLMLAVSTETMRSSTVGMVVGMTGVFFVGLQQALGENCACVRFRRFSKHALSCWGAGTGLAGIFPPMLYSAISGLELSVRFIIVVPLLAVYFGICVAVYNAGTSARRRDAEVSYREDGVRVGSYEAASPGVDDVHAEEGELRRGEHSDTISATRFGFAAYVIIVFTGVYGLEYFIFPTLIDRATKCPWTSPLGKQAYNNSWISYNIGVTISRGSIAFFQFPCLWLLLILQAVNVGFWTVEMKTHSLQALGGKGYMIQYSWMVWIGLMGGTAYANCIRQFHCSPRIPAEKRDMLINFTFMVSMMMILASTGLGELLENTIWTVADVTRNCPTLNQQ